MTMHLLSTINAHYTAPFQVTVQSMLDHLPGHRKVQWHILHPGMSEASRAAVESMAVARRVSFHWYEISPDRLTDYPVRGHFVPHVYSRILAPDVLPDAVERFLYLDADLLLLDDISKLWALPLDGMIVAAAPDMAVPRVSSPMGLRRYAELGINADSPYFNAGVYLADASAWKQASITHRAMAYLDQHRNDINLLDQDAMNAVLHGHWKRLDIRWNLIASLSGRQHYQPLDISPVEYHDALENPAIVHFAGLLKPWIQPGIASYKTANYLETLHKIHPQHRLRRSCLSNSMGFYDRNLRQIFYPVEKQIWHLRKGF